MIIKKWLISHNFQNFETFKLGLHLPLAKINQINTLIWYLLTFQMYIIVYYSKIRTNTITKHNQRN